MKQPFSSAQNPSINFVWLVVVSGNQERPTKDPWYRRGFDNDSTSARNGDERQFGNAVLNETGFSAVLIQTLGSI